MEKGLGRYLRSRRWIVELEHCTGKISIGRKTNDRFDIKSPRK